MMQGQDCLKEMGKEHEQALERLEMLKTLLMDMSRQLSPHGYLKTFGELISAMNKEIRFHFRKEEEALFPAMETFLPPDSGPLYVMKLEHDAIKQAFMRLKNAVQNIQVPETNTEKLKSVLLESGFHFVSLLRNHIQKEDHVLFPMAVEHLSYRAWAQLAQKCGAVEKDEVYTEQ